jgi:hypothetical protein
MGTTDTMLRVSPEFVPLGPGAMGKERIIMGNVALAEELASAEELDELYKLDASESDPEDEEDEDDDDEEGDDKEEPEIMPQG